MLTEVFYNKLFYDAVVGILEVDYTKQYAPSPLLSLNNIKSVQACHFLISKMCIFAEK